MNNSDQEFKCVLCDEKFPIKEELQSHFRKHADPNFNQKKKGKLQNEANDAAGKSKDQTEMVECDVCPEMFISIAKAITHKHKVHPCHDTKYFCCWCGKLFTMKHLHNKHLNAAHPNIDEASNKIMKSFHCDPCDMDFVYSALTYHNKFFHKQDELSNIGHSKKSKMVGQDNVAIFYCPFCGEEYNNKINLQKHMTDDHSDENQNPEDILRCPLCEAIFYHLDAYELHLTYHSVDDLYTERNRLVDEITDFSLETVQPLQEKIESAGAQLESEPMGIEELLEFTMDDAAPHRKYKKHKKHKKSKKSAITLDEFLNMNKDVFGEGIDFQGVEEVPTQVVAKRLKASKTPSKVMSSDIAKLKRQGIIVKKQSKNVEQPMMAHKAISNPVSTPKNIPPTIQPKINKLSSDDVLSKLLNQGSQIKIVKKSNQDKTEENSQQEDDNVAKEKLNDDSIDPKPCDNLKINTATEINEKKTDSVSLGKDTAIPMKQMLSSATSPEMHQDSESDENDIKKIQNSYEVSSDSKQVNDSADALPDYTEKTVNFVGNLQNNSNIVIQKSKEKPLTESEGDSFEKAHDYDDVDDISNTPINKPNNDEGDNNIDRASEKPCLDAIRHLSHLLTVKPINQTQNSQTSVNENNKIVNIVQNTSTKIAEVKNLSSLKKLGDITIKSNSISPKQSPKEETINDDSEVNHSSKDEDTIVENHNNVSKFAHVFKNPQLSIQSKQSSKINEKNSPKLPTNIFNSRIDDDLPKHIKHATTSNLNNINIKQIDTPKSSPDTSKKCASSKSLVQTEFNEEGIEVYNIDDSDSDEGNYVKNKSANISSETETNSKIETKKSTDVLRNLSKNITIKSTKIEKQFNKSLEKANEESDNDSDGTETLANVANKFNSLKQAFNHHTINNSILKNLSKNIIITSRNSSPNRSVLSQDHNSRDSILEAHDRNDNSEIGTLPANRVKITEIDNMSDGESADELRENEQENVKIEHPDDSHSDHSAHEDSMDEEFDEFPDIESEISKVHKIVNISKSAIKSPRNLNKDVKIKPPLNSNTDSSLTTEEIPVFAKNLGNQISIKQIKNPDNKVVNKVEQASTQSSNQTFNQKVASSSNQVNTVNKEVKTVKTFHSQTETVIQEITTTVTKTIKTVNQSSKQEFRNLGQSISTLSAPQKVQGLNSNAKNFQGVTVRQSTPNVRPRIRGPAPQSMRPAICVPPATSRPSICAPIRPSNQVVPMRQSTPRPSGPRPRLPNAMTVRPSTSGQKKPQTGERPMKISPGAVITTPKRPTETSGHFSCFKKPKESLIPVPDLSMSNDDDDETAQFSSAVHMSKSNFSSTTRTVKGNSVVTATKMKSERSASSQQLNKLQGMAGLSVVKTSQARQTHVEEHTEMSESKRNTLEAIQKLQSQGLLVKKPRLDVNEDSDHSQPGSDDNMGCNSSGEFDE